MKENRWCKDIILDTRLLVRIQSCWSRVAKGPIGFFSWDGVGSRPFGKTNHNKPRPRSYFFLRAKDRDEGFACLLLIRNLGFSSQAPGNYMYYEQDASFFNCHSGHHQRNSSCQLLGLHLNRSFFPEQLFFQSFQYYSIDHVLEGFMMIQPIFYHPESSP